MAVDADIRDGAPLLVSACLLGICTRFDGGARPRPAVAALGRHTCLVPVCPEQLGGLPTPRPPAEIQGGGGADVLAGSARVVTRDGADVSAAFVRGAEQVLRIGELVGARRAVLKARSPSCGYGQTYDGSFTGSLQEASGVTAALLERAGYEVSTEEDCE